MIFRLVLIALLIVTTVSLPAQRKAKKERAKKINAIYVPRDIYDAHKELDKKTTEDYQSQIRNWKEKESVYKTKHSLGLVLRHDWELWNGSRLSAYFNSIGIFNPNDMSEIVIRTYHRYLNGQPLLIGDLVKEHIQKWEDLKGIDVEEDEN